MKKTKLKLQHHVIEEKREVWIVCSSSITAKGIPALVKSHFPGYKPCLCSQEYFEELTSHGT